MFGLLVELDTGAVRGRVVDLVEWPHERATDLTAAGPRRQPGKASQDDSEAPENREQRHSLTHEPERTPANPPSVFAATPVDTKTVVPLAWQVAKCDYLALGCRAGSAEIPFHVAASAHRRTADWPAMPIPAWS